MTKHTAQRLTSVFITLTILAGALLLFKDVALGITPSVDTDKVTYLLGEDIPVSGSIDFTQGEVLPITQVTLDISGPQSLQQTLPVSPGHYDYPDNNLSLDVLWQNIGFGYGYGYSYKGLGSPSAITYDVTWDAPILKDPAPVFSLVPQTTAAFNIPSLPPAPEPTPGGPVDLPSATELFSIPQVDVPGPAPGAPAELPTVTESFTIPQLPVPQPPTGVPTLDESPNTALAFDLPTAQLPHALASDGTDFYVVVDGVNPGDPDQIQKISASGTLLDTLTAPSGLIEGIAYLGGSLWVTDNEDLGSGKRIRKLDPTTGSEQSSFAPPNQFDEYGGIGVSGTSLWLARKDGCELTKISQTGSQQQQVFTPCDPHDFHGVVESGGFLFTLNAGTVRKWNTSGQEQQSWNTSLVDLRGSELTNGVFYMLDADTTAVYKTAVPSGISITTNPLGITHDGTNIWVLIDATPVDKIAKIDPSNGGLLDSFDSPATKSQGITYFGGFLWVATNDNDSRKAQKMDPSTGVVATSVSIPGWGDMGGLTNDGTNMVAIGSTDNNTTFFNTLGQEQQSAWVNGSAMNGATGLAFDSPNSRAFVAKTGTVMRVNTQLDVQQTWNTTLTDIQGQTYYDAVLYLADAGTGKVYSASIPSGISVTVNPRGMTYDGTDLYILVDGTPADKVLRVSTANGALLDSFDASSSQTDAIAYLGGQLYVAVNQSDPCCSRNIVVHNPSTGAQVTSFSAPGFDDVTGLVSDGTNLLSGPKFGGNVQVFDSSGNNQGQFWLDGMDGIEAMAYNTSSDQVYAVKGNSIRRYSNSGGQSLQQWTTTLSTINGAAFVGEFIYMVDTTTDKVYAASIPTPPVTVTTTPKGMTSDGTNLYILVEASPLDKVIKVDTTGTLLDSFDAPANNTDAIDYLGGALYISVNEDLSGGCCGFQPTIFKVNKDTGATDTSFQVNNVWDSVTALGSDGTSLILGQQMGGNWRLVDPLNPSSAQEVWQNSQGFPWMEGFQSFEYVLGNLYAASGNQLNKFDKNTGQTLDSWFLQGGTLNVKGLAYIGTTLYIADSGSDGVRASTFPENIPELTIAGNYEAKLVVETNGQTLESSLASFAIAKNSQVQVNITSPADGFSSFTPGVNIAGNLNDPSISQVNVGIALPFTTLFDDDVQDPGSASLWNANGLWHTACQGSPDDFFPKSNSFPCSWYYGKDSSQNYETGSTNAGDLVMVGPNTDGSFSVGADTNMTFWTWWNTEPGTEFDRKQVQVSADNGSTWQTIAMILPPFEMDFSTGQPFFVPQELQGQNIQWLPIPQAHFEFSGGSCPPFCDSFGGGKPAFDPVDVNMDAFTGQDILIRFHFETVDAAVNALEGWYIDDVKIGGAGFQGVVAQVTPVTDPALLSQSIFGTFQTVFNLAEGINTVTASAATSYDPSLKGSAEITGFLDTTPPIVTLDQIDSPTNTPTATLSGFIKDVNFNQLIITHTTVLGTKTIITLKELPQDNTFTKSVSLVEGVNTFEATASDGAGLSGSATTSVVLDSTGPVLTVLSPSYPIGVISARPDDPVIFNVDASDDGSGVDHVEIIFPGGGGGQPTIGGFIPSADIPQAVRDLWNSTGDWVLPLKVPTTAPPGSFSLTVRAYDNAGNQTVGTVTATVVPSLEAFAIDLMPNWNLVSMPLIPDTADIATLTAGLTGIDAIWYYDATLTNLPLEDRWLLYTPDTGDVDTLTALVTGRGYWFMMDPNAFTLSAPLGPGLPQTPKPIQFTYTGSFLQPGSLPPSYTVASGWNSIGFHSETELPVTTALQTLESPVRIWGSLFQYNNRIVFELPDDPTEEPIFEILLGSFQRILATDSMTSGYGYWVFMVDDGVIVP